MKRKVFSAFASHRLAEADARAERLLGFVRMAVALVLALTILSTIGSEERPDDSVLDRRLAFAVIGMLGYFFVGLFVVLYVRPDRPRRWIAWFTALADVSLISWNVFGVVHFSEFNSLYALAFPSSLMVPLILTFGALRYRPEVQVVATVLTAVLISIVVFSGAGKTTDAAFISTQLSITFGVPPNIIRILMILGAGLIVALAVYRAKRLLETTVMEAEAKANLGRFLPANLTRDMDDAALQQLRQGRRQVLGIVFIDIRDFTQFSESAGPDALRQSLTQYRGRIMDVVERFGGTVDKFIGDGALILFGLTRDDNQTADVTLAACAALAERCAEGDLKVGIGAHLGEVFVGAIGDERRLEFTVIGQEVNLASRIEQMTKETGRSVLASDALVRAAADTGDWQRVASFEVRGVSDSVSVWSLA